MSLTLIRARVADLALYLFFVVVWALAIFFTRYSTRAGKIPVFIIMLASQTGQTIFTCIGLVLSARWVDRANPVWLSAMLATLQVEAYQSLRSRAETIYVTLTHKILLATIGLSAGVQVVCALLSLLVMCFDLEMEPFASIWQLAFAVCFIVNALASVAIMVLSGLIARKRLLFPSSDSSPWATPMKPFHTMRLILAPAVHLPNITMLSILAYYLISKASSDKILVTSMVNTRTIGILWFCAYMVEPLYDLRHRKMRGKDISRDDQSLEAPAHLLGMRSQQSRTTLRGEAGPPTHLLNPYGSQHSLNNPRGPQTVHYDPYRYGHNVNLKIPVSSDSRWDARPSTASLAPALASHWELPRIPPPTARLGGIERIRELKAALQHSSKDLLRRMSKANVEDPRPRNVPPVPGIHTRQISDPTNAYKNAEPFHPDGNGFTDISLDELA